MATVPLEYRPVTNPRHRWRRWAWRAAWIGLVLAVAWAGHRYGPPVWRHAQLLYWQRQCLAYTLPPGQVVYAEDPNEAARLIAGGGYTGNVMYRSPRSWRLTGNDDRRPTALRDSPACWRKLRALVPRAMPPGPGLAGPIPFGAGQSVVFLHEMRRPDGRRRLVCVTVSARTMPSEPAFFSMYRPQVQVIDPATWTATARDVSRGSAVVGASRPQRPGELRIYAGQTDPTDPSRFTIGYDAFGQRLMLEGRLTDKDLVVFTPQDAPATQPAK